MKDCKCKNNLSGYIKSLRSKRKLTQQELADKAGVELTLVSALEDGKMKVKIIDINKVLNVFGEEIKR